MSHVVIETTVPVVVTSDDAHEPPVVVNAVQTTTVFVESAPEVIEVNAGPRGLPGPQGPQGEKGDDGDVPDAPLTGSAYARQSGAWVEALTASARGAAGGVASLDASGKVPESQMPVIPDAVSSVAGKTGAVTLVSADVTGLDAALAGKADNSVALTDAAATATLPATAAAPVASRLQVLRNNVKQAFADIGTKLNTNFASLTTRTIDGTETLAFSGGLKATVQAVLDWVLGRANTWTGTQTFNGAVFTPTAVLSDTTATTYSAYTWYEMPGTAPAIGDADRATYLAELSVQYSSTNYQQYVGSCVISTVGWKAGDPNGVITFPMEKHDGNSISVDIQSTVSRGARGFLFRFGSNVTVSSGGFVRLTLLRLI